MSPLWIPLLLLPPLAIVAWWLKIFPRRRLVALAAVPLAISLLIIFGVNDVLRPLVIIDIVLLVVAIIDAATLPRRSAFTVERAAGRVASLAKPHPVTLTIANTSQRPLTVQVRDDLPEGMAADPDHFELRLDPRSRAVVQYDLRPERRGAFEQQSIYVQALSKLGLWQRQFRYPATSTINVYPDLKQLAEYEVLARTNRLALMGVRRTRRIGVDNEFERLRDYSFDDNHKHIDWRATARRSKLTVRDFQTNQSQRVVFLIDCGRMMTNVAAGVSLLDHAFNAALMLSFIALRQGDSVGLLTFSDTVHTYVSPQGGRSQMNRLLHACFDRFPKLVESRYDQAFLHLATNCRKRALVVLMTNVIDEVNANQVSQYLTNLVGRHLPLGVLLRDHQLFDAVDPTVLDRDQTTRTRPTRDFYRSAAAAEILLWRRQVLHDLRAQGVLSLDAFPEQMTAPLINQYLDAKARHLL